MITEHTDLYAEYLKIKVKHTRYENKAERKIDSLQKEIEQLKTRHKKEVAKLRLELIALKREAAPERTYNQSNGMREIEKRTGIPLHSIFNRLMNAKNLIKYENYGKYQSYCEALTEKEAIARVGRHDSESHQSHGY
jgi:hypothetical protein